LALESPYYYAHQNIDPRNRAAHNCRCNGGICVPKVSAIAINSCSLLDFPAPAFEVLIASPVQKSVDINSPWLRIFFDLEPKSNSAFTFRFDNKYVTIYLNGIRSEKVMGSVTFPRIADGKNLQGTFDLQTSAGDTSRGGSMLTGNN
jgi:hypothetical protein